MTDSTASTDDVWTVQRILHWTTDYLQKKEIESARLEAELLLAHARSCRRIQLYADFDTPLTDAERSRMRELVKRRASYEPIAYITGRKEFYGRDFAVGSGVLVPRPETETLVDICLDHLPKGRPARVCEIGFGSGCIAITLARQRPELRIVATDISEVAVRYASENRAAHQVEKQVELLLGDLFGPLASLNVASLNEEKFDGIVSNPPYIREDEMPGLDPDVLRHEPHEALVSGEDGLNVVRSIIQQSHQYLKPGGWIAMEVDPAQCDVVAALLAANEFTDGRIHKDLSGNDRIVEAKLKA